MSVRLTALLAAVVLTGCLPAGPRAGGPPASPQAEAPEAPEPMAAEPPGGLPPVPREFRGVWVATVANIDWPSEPGLPVAEQKAELLAILDRARELNLNAVILQVRPAGDALYDSPYEPWSEYLTGEMGTPPEPFYDPLAFAVREAHRRGLELHAWFNPYRARHPSGRSGLSPDHIARTHPELVRQYGDLLWMDPGEPAVREHSLRVILDVVRRYDIDGVHLDDYFYPYQIQDATGATVDFPDDRSWRRYVESGGTLERDDWRRHNVDQFVRDLYEGTKALEPRVKFGISPFGIWRPGHPPQIEGYDAYANLYADARKWLRNGWVDYLTPQLYWPIGQQAQSYPVLLSWWAEQNVRGRHLWPGSIPSRVRSGRDDDGWPASEIVTQIYIARGHPGASGNVHFSMRRLMRDDKLTQELKADAYAAPALVPASPWLDAEPPAAPAVAASDTHRSDGRTTVMLEPARGEEEVWLWVVRTRWEDASVEGRGESGAGGAGPGEFGPGLSGLSETGPGESGPGLSGLSGSGPGGSGLGDSGFGRESGLGEGSGPEARSRASGMPFVAGSAATATSGVGTTGAAPGGADGPNRGLPSVNGRWTVEVVPGWKRRYVLMSPAPPATPAGASAMTAAGASMIRTAGASTIAAAGASAIRAAGPAYRPTLIAVSAVDRTGNISPATRVRP